MTECSVEARLAAALEQALQGTADWMRNRAG